MSGGEHRLPRGEVKALLAAAALLVSSAASAQCINVVDFERELPHEIDTPQGNHLS